MVMFIKEGTRLPRPAGIEPGQELTTEDKLAYLHQVANIGKTVTVSQRYNDHWVVDGLGEGAAPGVAYGMGGHGPTRATAIENAFANCTGPEEGWVLRLSTFDWYRSQPRTRVVELSMDQEAQAWVLGVAYSHVGEYWGGQTNLLGASEIAELLGPGRGL